jgi:chemotaxis protein histidine kinase CheA
VQHAKRRLKAPPPDKIEKGLDHEIIHPRNVLRAKAAVLIDGPKGLDESAIRRAEQALQALSGNFNGWMEATCKTLVVARDALRESGGDMASRNALHRAAHDVRGQATTLGFPLATRVGTSLCLLLEHTPAGSLMSPTLTALIDQHVDAIRAITREGITKATHRVGERLATELEAVTEKIIADFNGQTVH